MGLAHAESPGSRPEGHAVPERRGTGGEERNLNAKSLRFPQYIYLVVRTYFILVFPPIPCVVHGSNVGPLYPNYPSGAVML
eukprot:COSAG05_NODE_816_length_7150_cov_3.975606_3_plen_81_part_00